MNRVTSRLVASGATLATAAGAALVSAPAHAAGNRFPIGSHEHVVVAECADGGTVLGPLEGSASVHQHLDRDGNVIAFALMMEYKMTWTLSSTGQSVSPHGTRRILFDFVKGTVTETGNYRTLTVAGQGAVLKYAGRTVLDLETEELLRKAGPDRADIGDPSFDNDLVCGLFGVDGAPA